jgi:Ca2+-dependent lipid-binding protein
MVYPNTGKSEFINEIISKLWSRMSVALSQKIDQFIQPMIDQAKPNMIKSLKLKSLDLGDSPMRISGLKVISSSADELVFDVDLNFSGKPNFIFHVGLLQNSIEFDATLNRLIFSGNLRIVLSPLIDAIPCFSACSISFVKLPEISYDIYSAGLPITSIPGFGEWFDHFLKFQVLSEFVFPKKIYLPLTSLKEEIRLNLRSSASRYHGILHVHLIEGRNFPKLDKLGKCDAYCEIKLGNQTSRSKTKMHSYNPQWNELHNFKIYTFQDVLEITLYDFDLLSRDDLIGRIQIPVSAAVKQAQEMWIPIEGRKAEIHLKLTYEPYSVEQNSISSETTTSRESPQAQISENEKNARFHTLHFYKNLLKK